MWSVLGKYHKSNPLRSCSYNSRARPWSLRGTRPLRRSDLVEDMRPKFNQRSNISTLVLKRIPAIETGRPGEREGNGGDSGDFEDTGFSSRLVRVVKIPQELPHPPMSYRSKAHAESCARRLQCLRWACPRARRHPICARVTCSLRGVRSRACKRG